MTTHTQVSQSSRGVDQQLPADVLPTPYAAWPDDSFRLLPCLRAGALLGAIAGCVSLSANVIGSVAWPAISGQPQHPLRLIQVFLTFPLGRQALELDSGWTLATGCLLYLATGALYGMFFEFIAEYFLPRADLVVRAVLFSVLAIAVWSVNFYGILLWLHPLVFGGTWIVELIPWWVAAITHILFGITMALISPTRVRPIEPFD